MWKGKKGASESNRIFDNNFHKCIFTQKILIFKRQSAKEEN